MIYLSLFIISFLSATLLPLGSEGVLVYDISQGYPLFTLWFIATLGNTLGAIFNYWIGNKGEKYLLHKGYLNAQGIQKYHNIFTQYGAGVLLLSWMPIIGDPLTFIAGVLRYPFRYFILWVSLAKGLRYAFVIFVANSLSV